jgi:hypothetical protein
VAPPAAPGRRRTAAAKQRPPAAVGPPVPAAGSRQVLGGTCSSEEEEEAPPLRQRLGYAPPPPAAAAGGGAAVRARQGSGGAAGSAGHLGAGGAGQGCPEEDEAGLDRFDIEQLQLAGFSRGACVQVRSLWQGDGAALLCTACWGTSLGPQGGGGARGSVLPHFMCRHTFTKHGWLYATQVEVGCSSRDLQVLLGQCPPPCHAVLRTTLLVLQPQPLPTCAPISCPHWCTRRCCHVAGTWWRRCVPSPQGGSRRQTHHHLHQPPSLPHPLCAHPPSVPGLDQQQQQPRVVGASRVTPQQLAAGVL